LSISWNPRRAPADNSSDCAVREAQCVGRHPGDKGQEESMRHAPSWHRLARRMSTVLWVLTLATTPAWAQTGAESSVGYIDSAVPRTQFRLRYDSAYDNNRPDRAAFFYPKCGCFQDA